MNQDGLQQIPMREFSTTLTGIGLAAAVVLTASPTVAEISATNPLRLWYDPAAARREEALPVGNGLIGALTPTSRPEIELLPALPPAWPTGRVKGLRARGGFEVDVTWKDGKLTQTVVRSLNGGTAQLRYGPVTQAVKLAKGKAYRWNGK